MFGIISGIASVSSACISAVSSACSVIGGAISAAGSMLATALKVSAPDFQTICKTITVVAQVMGLFPRDAEVKDLHELGMRAEVAGLSPEEFKSYQNYIDHLRNEIQIDRSKLNNLSDDDKIKYAAVGSAVLAKGVSDNFTVSVPASCWSEFSKLGLEPVQAKGMLDQFEKDGVEPDIEGFFERSLDSATNLKVYESLEKFVSDSVGITEPAEIEQYLIKLVAERSGAA